MKEEEIEKLKVAAKEQLAARLEEYVCKDVKLRFNSEVYAHFLRYMLDSPGASGLVQTKHLYDDPLGRGQKHFVRDVAEDSRAVYTPAEEEGSRVITRFTFIPRGVIIPANIEHDRVHLGGTRRVVKRGFVAANKALTSLVSPRLGQHIFSTQEAYFGLLGDTEVLGVMQKYASQGIYALFRCDREAYLPEKHKPGWFSLPTSDWKVKGIAPVLIIPGISPEDLEFLVQAEKIGLGI